MDSRYDAWGIVLLPPHDDDDDAAAHPPEDHENYRPSSNVGRCSVWARTREESEITDYRMVYVPFCKDDDDYEDAVRRNWMVLVLLLILLIGYALEEGCYLPWNATATNVFFLQQIIIVCPFGS
jgi:hypothetical protein